MKNFLSLLVLTFSVQSFAGNVVLRPDGDAVNINGTQVSCAKEPLNISPIQMTDAGLYAMALNRKLGKCFGYTYKQLVSSTNGSNYVAAFDVKIAQYDDFSGGNVVFTVAGSQVDLDPVFAPTNVQLKQVGDVLRDLIKSGECSK